MAYNRGGTRLTEGRMPYITDDEQKAYERARTRGNMAARSRICQLAKSRQLTNDVQRPHLLNPKERASAKPSGLKPEAKAEAQTQHSLQALAVAFRALSDELMRFAGAPRAA